MKKNTVRPVTINLLRQHDQSLFDSVFSWALSVGRLLIIITQFIALGAFLFRFVLDRQIIDLNDKITDKQNVVRVLEKDEKIYRSLQARLVIIAKYQEEAGNKEKLMTRIVDAAKGKMEFTSLIVDAEGASIEGNTTSVRLLQSLINEYRSMPGVTGVSINTIETISDTNRVKAGIALSFATLAESASEMPVEKPVTDQVTK